MNKTNSQLLHYFLTNVVAFILYIRNHLSFTYSESNISTSTGCQYKSSEKVIKEQINKTKYFKFQNDCD